MNRSLPNKLVPFVWYYLKNYKFCLLGFVLGAIISALEMSVTPYLLKTMIDSVANIKNTVNVMSVILVPGILYVSMSLVLNLNSALQGYIGLKLFPSLKKAVKKDVLSYVLLHSHTYFQNVFSGNLTRKIGDLADCMMSLVSKPVSNLFSPILAVVIASMMVYKIVHPLLGVILIVWAVMFVYVTVMIAKKMEKFSRTYAGAMGDFSGTVSDSILNIMSIKLFDNIPHELCHVDKTLQEAVSIEHAQRLFSIKVEFIQGVAILFLIASMFVLLAHGFAGGWVTPGDFALVFTVIISFIQAVRSIGEQIQSFSNIIGIFNQSLTVIKMPHEISDEPNAKALNVSKGEIVFENVTFQYELGKPLFNNLNITIYEGEKIGLVGYSGAGKTTFIKLILRVIDTISGDILIDGQSIKKVTQSSLRGQISTIQQESELFNRTIMDNIRYAQIDASDEQVIEAAIRAKCHEFILDFPQQYQSLVGERGVKLSGGQKQRIAIARAFLKNARILILDEATSALDSITEADIQTGLKMIMENKTSIVIAHRISTLKNMDRILVFDNGKIIQQGSLNVLLEDKEGQFYKFWEMQSMGYIVPPPLLNTETSGG